VDWFVKLIAIAFGAIFAENLVFAGGLGTGQMLRAAKKPAHLGVYGLLVSGYIFMTNLITWPINRMLGFGQWAGLLRPLFFTAVMALLYFGTVLALKWKWEQTYQKLVTILPMTSLNCVVLAVPFLVGRNAYTFVESVFFALGAGIGFMLAILLLSEGMDTIENQDMPKAFRGLPTALIYIGILSLAVVGFTGTGIF